MKINKDNEQLKEYFNKIKYNMINSLDIDENILITSSNKYEILSKMQEHDENIKDIYKDVNLILENPYYKNINLKDINNGEFEYINEFIPKNKAINISWILSDKNKEMNDYMEFGCFKKAVSIPILKQGKDIWMSPTLAEQNTINPFIEKAHGNVLTFGLGIGYFPYMCSLKDNVKSITIVELNKDVIDMFNEYILPQFNTDVEINIVHGDIFEYFEDDFLDKFDYIFVDTWKDNEHGFYMIEKLLEKTNYKGNIDYWIEFSCYTSFRMLIALYFIKLHTGKLTEYINDYPNPEDRLLIKKIHRYFRTKDILIDDVDTIKKYLYDIETLREILSIKL